MAYVTYVNGVESTELDLFALIYAQGAAGEALAPADMLVPGGQTTGQTTKQTPERPTEQTTERPTEPLTGDPTDTSEEATPTEGGEVSETQTGDDRGAGAGCSSLIAGSMTVICTASVLAALAVCRKKKR